MQLSMNNKAKDTKQFSKRLIIIPTIAGLIVLPAIILGMIFKLIKVDSDTYNTYHELMVNTGAKEEVKNSPYSIRQERKNVQKDILFIEDEKRMQLKIIASDAELVLDHHDNETEIVEQMRGVCCDMQEELYYLLPNGDKTNYAHDNLQLKEMQRVSRMRASHGTYHYKSDLFRAKNVEIEKFIASGHDFATLLSVKKLMTGIADFAQFSLDGKRLEFQADKLKATLHAPIKELQ